MHSRSWAVSVNEKFEFLISKEIPFEHVCSEILVLCADIFLIQLQGLVSKRSYLRYIGK